VGRKGLSERQRKFACAYAAEGNATRAYLEAGYKPGRTPQATGAMACRLLNNPDLAKLVEAEREINRGRLDLRTGRVLAEISAVAFSNVFNCLDEQGHIKPPAEIHPLTQLAVSEYSEVVLSQGDEGIVLRRKVKMHPKWPALHAVAGYVGLGKGIDPFTGRVSRALAAVRLSMPDGTEIERDVERRQG